MPLVVSEIRDLESFVEAYTTTIVARDAPTAFNTISAGWNFGIGDGATISSFHNASVYNQITDQVYFHCLIVKEDTGGAVALRINTHARDALGLNSSVGWWRDIASVYSGSQRRLKMGQPNLQNGTQKLYCYNTATGGTGHYEISTLTGDPVATNIWPNLPDDFNDSNILTGNAGYFQGDNTTPDERPTNVLIFDGITDTTDYDDGLGDGSITGILRGGSTHAKGLALQTVERMNFAGGADTGRRWCWIDLDTGEAVGILGLPTNVDTTNTNTFAEPTLDGETFFWGHIQFVADEGSTFARPKGEIHLTTSNSAAREKVGLNIVTPSGNFTSLATRQYVAVHDFNPFNVQTGTVRVHNRRSFLGVIDCPQEPIIAGGGNMTGAADGVSVRSVNILYHPPSRTYFTQVNRPTVIDDDTAGEPATGNSRIIRWRRSIVVDRLSTPTPTTAVTESRTIRARVVAHTDLGARAPGAQITYVLSRYSTRAESFDGTATGAGTYTVEADQIDDDLTLDVREANDVDNGGTLLVETTDYTVNYGTGVLTPVGSWPTDTIYVRYRHRGVKLTPPHGTLLTGTGTTDGDGLSLALVRYGDNVDGELDVLEASTP